MQNTGRVPVPLLSLEHSIGKNLVSSTSFIRYLGVMIFSCVFYHSLTGITYFMTFPDYLSVCFLDFMSIDLFSRLAGAMAEDDPVDDETLSRQKVGKCLNYNLEDPNRRLWVFTTARHVLNEHSSEIWNTKLLSVNCDSICRRNSTKEVFGGVLSLSQRRIAEPNEYPGAGVERALVIDRCSPIYFILASIS